MFRFKWFLAATLAVGAAGLTYSASEVANAAEPVETRFNDSDSEDGFAADKGDGDKAKSGQKGGKKGKKGGKKKGKKGPPKKTEEDK